MQTLRADLCAQQGRERVGRAESRRDVCTPLCAEQTHPEQCCRRAQGPRLELPDDLGGGGGAGRGQSQRKEMRACVQLVHIAV